jgi:iron(III) transport system substrate-binding protein
MRSKAPLRKLLTVLLVLGGLASVAEAGSVEELLAEINKLPPAARQKRLEEGARREGAFKFYGVSNADLLGAYTAGFMKRYPFIKAEFWRGSGNKLVFRTLTEHRTGRLDADAVLVGTENVMALKKAGIYVRYHSPESQFYPKYFYDPDGYWHADTLGIATMAYNSQLVKKEQAPRGYEDLFDPKWKGNLSIDLEPERALMGWLVAWGEKKTRAFVEGLIKNDVLVRRGHTLQAQLLCAGEFKVAVEVYPDAILRMKNKGCPAEIVFPTPTPAEVSSPIGIYANTQHPHAAALFVDFMKSAGGAKILAATGRISGRKGINSLYQELSNLEERGIPLVVITPEKTEEVAKPMQKIMKEILVR